MKVKICGLFGPADAEVACDAGADMLGVIFAPAPRERTVAEAKAIFDAATGPVERVGVFVDASLDEVESVLRECGLDWIQLAGRESPEYCAALDGRAVKTLRLPSDQDRFEAYDLPLFHLDADDAERAGGTGKVWDYSLARAIAARYHVMLAGGLTPANVGGAIAAARPFGVDVCSGVETDGVKDPEKIVAFVQSARAAFAMQREPA